MDLEDIKSLIGMAERLNLAGLDASKGGVTLRLVREAQPKAAAERSPSYVATGPASAATPSPISADLIAPLSGVLHLTASPGAPPFVTPGQTVKRGETLCIIEAMKVFNRVSAERDGTISAVLFQTGAEIEVGQIVMRIA